ncbi:MAG: hypothetical protein PHP08_03860 [Candidatus Dojkabacteria bacterium]|nr:hypothetical protein [Candidatus Dojkabacteria bacterium]
MEQLIHKENLEERRKNLKSLWASGAALDFYLSNSEIFGFNIEVVENLGKVLVEDLDIVRPGYRGLIIPLENQNLFIHGSSFTEESSQEFLTLGDISEVVYTESEILNQDRGIAQMA